MGQITSAAAPFCWISCLSLIRLDENDLRSSNARATFPGLLQRSSGPLADQVKFARIFVIVRESPDASKSCGLLALATRPQTP